MGRHEIGQRQRVVAVGHRPGELPQRQAANPPVIILHELAVDLHAVLRVEDKGFALGAGKLPEPIEAGVHPAGVFAVGPAGGLHLQHAHVDPHLKHLAPIAGADQPRGQHARLKRPLVEDEIDVVLLGVGLFRHRDVSYVGLVGQDVSYRVRGGGQ